MRFRDQRAAAGVEEELKRLFELDRRHRLRNGAADTNLAALRERVRQRQPGCQDDGHPSKHGPKLSRRMISLDVLTFPRVGVALLRGKG